MRKHKASRTKSIARRHITKEKSGSSHRTGFRGPLPRPVVRADDPTLTSHAGLLPVISFMSQQLDLVTRLRAIVGWVGRERTHPIHLVLQAFVVGALAGVERMAHLDEALRGDPVLVKFLRLARWPVRKVFALALGVLNDRARDALVDLVSEFGLNTLPKNTTSVVADIDPTALIDNGEGEGSMFGYCGKGRRRRRHFPLVASVAEGRAIVLAKYRDGSNITAEEMIEFMAELIRRLRAHLGPDCKITLRGDAGIWCPTVGNWLRQQGVPFVMAQPLSAAVKLHLHTLAFAPVDKEGDIESAHLPGQLVGIGPQFRIAVIRRKVHNPAAPPQGKQVDGLPHWRYQAVVSDQDWEPPDLWRFYNGRADCERVFRVGKQALALGHLVSRGFRTNEIAFLLRALAFNVDIAFQAHCERSARETNRPVRRFGLEWRQPRFYRTAGRLLREAGRWVLRVPANDFLADLWTFYAPDLVATIATNEVLAN
jgi:hypothetical protein